MGVVRFINYILIGYLLTLWLSNWDVKRSLICSGIALPISIWIYRDDFRK